MPLKKETAGDGAEGMDESKTDRVMGERGQKWRRGEFGEKGLRGDSEAVDRRDLKTKLLGMLL